MKTAISILTVAAAIATSFFALGIHACQANWSWLIVPMSIAAWAFSVLLH